MVYSLAAVWLALFVAAFLNLDFSGRGGDAFVANVERMVSFLTWHGSALVVAAVLALVTRHAVGRGVEKIGLVGFAPLGVSVFLIASLIAIIAYRFLIAPAFG